MFTKMKITRQSTVARTISNDTKHPKYPSILAFGSERSESLSSSTEQCGNVEEGGGGQSTDSIGIFEHGSIVPAQIDHEKHTVHIRKHMNPLPPLAFMSCNINHPYFLVVGLKGLVADAKSRRA